VPVRPRTLKADRLWVERSLSRCRVAVWCGLFVVVALVAEGCAARARPNGPPTNGAPPSQSSFTATAYCTGKVTASGTRPTAKTVAADPAFLPMGSRIRLTGLDGRYNGVYIVEDTGSSVRGRRIDLYIRDCPEAIRFGRRSARVSILHD
jgi:3D (Asp-Asp-Asp) domain-containing protein